MIFFNVGCVFLKAKRKRKGGTLAAFWVNYVTLDLTQEFDLGIFKVKFRSSCNSGIVIWLIWNKTKSNQVDIGPMVWVCSLTTPMNLTLKFQRSTFEIALFHEHEREWGAGVDWHGTEGIWVDHSGPWWGRWMYWIVTGWRRCVVDISSCIVQWLMAHGDIELQ